jgi:hypothetical protein
VVMVGGSGGAGMSAKSRGSDRSPDVMSTGLSLLN